MPNNNTQKAIGIGGEWWVAGILQLQGADSGYRISIVSIDDAGTDLFLFKSKDNSIINMYEIQVKTARTLHKNNAVFGMIRPLQKGMKNTKRIYIFIYAPDDIKYCWVMTEEEIAVHYPKKKNIPFSCSPDAKDKGIYYRCNPNILFKKVLKKIS